MKKKLRVYAALQEESNAGWIWIPKNDSIKSIDVIKISCSDRSIVCVARIIDERFVSYYAESPKRLPITDIERAIVISDYYRDNLGGIQTKNDYTFEIEKIPKYCCLPRLKAFWYHPDNAIKVATRLAVTSIVLGIIGIALAVISMVIK